MSESVYTIIDRLAGEVARALLASTSRTAAIVCCASPDRPLRWPIDESSGESGEQLFQRLLTAQLPEGGCYTDQRSPQNATNADRSELFAQFSAIRERHAWLIWQFATLDEQTLQRSLPYFELVYLVLDGATADDGLTFDLRAWRRSGIRPRGAWYVNAA